MPLPRTTYYRGEELFRQNEDGSITISPGVTSERLAAALIACMSHNSDRAKQHAQEIRNLTALNETLPGEN